MWNGASNMEKGSTVGKETSIEKGSNFVWHLADSSP